MSLKWLISATFLPPVLLLPVWLSSLPFCFAERPDFADGEQLFRHQWQHESAKQTAGFTQPAFVRQAITRTAKQPGDGLGPMFNAESCEACHASGGSSGVERNVTLLTLDPRTKFSEPEFRGSDAIRDQCGPFFESGFRGSDAMRDQLLELYPALISPTGRLEMNVVVHEKSARPFYQAIRENLLRWVPGSVPQGWFTSDQRTADSVAQRPVLAGRKGKLDFYLSQRNSPPLFGLGLIDLVETTDLHKIARAQKRRTSGKVSGRVGVGKFGWRAQSVSLEQFVRQACAGELGLQVERNPQTPDAADETYLSFGMDVSEPEVGMLVSYVRELPAPRMATPLPAARAAILKGKRLFEKIGCSICHVENIFPARGIYSDLLLHDMGDLLQAPEPAPLSPALASVTRLRLPRFSRQLPSTPNFLPSMRGYFGVPSAGFPRPYPITRPVEPRFPRGKLPVEANQLASTDDVSWDLMQREWRTPPLWGVADSAPYLHDGRSETLDSAIRWHGGEASQAAQAYRSLRSESREKILVFLASLHAPVRPAQQPQDHDNDDEFFLAAE